MAENEIYICLENGDVFKGYSFGADGEVVGELVFTTGMCGYIETLTDPSYYGQIVMQTFPLIGNYGIIPDDFESKKPYLSAYIVREKCDNPSNFRCSETLDKYLKDNGIVGVYGVDTREITKTIRESGVMNGAITTEFDPETEPEKLAALMPIIKAYAVTGAVDAVTCTEPQCFAPTAGVAEGEEPLHIALLDLGCKKNIVRCLCKRGCRVTVLPASTTLAELKALAPDGLMLSNGPGDPAENVQVIANIRDMLDTGIPAFGICLGHQLTALAAGAKTCKMKYGHRGANQPVTDFALERTFITSQNHGYAVLGDTLPAGTGRVSHVNANDKTCEGIEYLQWNCFTVQFHPEANGGPKDTEFLFDEFVKRMLAAKGVINDA